jgi:hypothetical protein
MGHHGMGRPFAAPGNSALYLFLAAFKHGLNPAVMQIAHPAGDAEALRRLTRLGAEKDALHMALNKYMRTNMCHDNLLIQQ